MSAIIFDTETTDSQAPEIIEAAWIGVNTPHDLTVGIEYCGRYKPVKPISLGALATHHIMDEELELCPPSSSFLLPEGVTYLIGHNVDFDWKAAGSPDVKRICTLALCRSLWPDLDSHTQTAMLYHLERPRARDLSQKAHSALCDVQNCSIILSHIVKQLRVATWEELWAESEKARIPKVMPFGKHKGMALDDVPWDYKLWLLRQSDIDPYLIKAIKAEVSN